MALFKYLGEVKRDYVVAYGPTKIIRVPCKDGSVLEFVADDPDVGWLPGETLPHDFDDERALRVLRADPRFEEVT